MKKIFINGKFLIQKTTGVQRVAKELSKALILKNSNNLHFEIIAPPSWLSNSLGCIFWEQVILPFKTRNCTLLSFCNIGPLLHPEHTIMIHDLAVFKNKEWFSKLFKIYYKAITPILIYSANTILTVSEFSKKEIGKYFGEKTLDKTKVIYNGIDLQLFSATKNKNIHNKLGIKESYFLCVGSIEPRKNLQRVLLAWQLAQNELKDTKLVIVGSQNTKVFSSVENLKNHQNVYYTNYITDAELIELYSNSIAFFYPSLYEGFGLPVLESMACGRPVVISEKSAMSEIAGSFGIAVNPYDIDAIKMQFINLFKEYPSVNQAVYREYISTKFSWENAAEQIIKRVLK